LFNCEKSKLESIQGRLGGRASWYVPFNFTVQESSHLLKAGQKAFEF
jgi:hypothetical protein